MRILLSCLQSQKLHSVPAYRFWRDYFVEGCREAGIECVEVPGLDWVEGLTIEDAREAQRWRADTWEKVVAWLKIEHAARPISFFLGYLYPKQIDAAAITAVRDLGVPTVNFFCDNVREFRSVPAEYRGFDLHWVPEVEAISMYTKAGLPYLNAPMPCWIPPAYRTDRAIEREPATFLGSADVLRRELLGRAVAAGADIFVRGPGWEEKNGESEVSQDFSFFGRLGNQMAFLKKHGPVDLGRKLANRLRPIRVPPFPSERVKPAVFGSDYFRVTREAEVAVGINRVPTFRSSIRHPLVYSRLRDIEAPMLGACYLTERTSGIAALYEVGKEIETYSTPGELAEKITMLKNDPSRRTEMRHRAQLRALNEHNISNTLARIVSRLGVNS